MAESSTLLFGFPLSFADLTDARSRAPRLKYMQQVHEAWLAIANVGGQYFSALKKRSPMQLPLVQEVFVRCKNNDWQVPPDVAQTLSDVFSHLACSWNEEAFSHMRRALRCAELAIEPFFEVFSSCYV